MMLLTGRVTSIQNFVGLITLPFRTLYSKITQVYMSIYRPTGRPESANLQGLLSAGIMSWTEPKVITCRCSIFLRCIIVK